MEKSVYIKGPSCYNETDKSVFWGREKESQELFYLVSNSDFVVCYAKSGEGKSSLLNAGLKPKLREGKYLPISVRFPQSFYKDKHPNFDSIVSKSITEVLKKENADYCSLISNNEKCSSILTADEKSISDTLWWKLRAYEVRKEGFQDLPSVRLTPILIFDQFEEIFTCSESVEWISNFFAWFERLSNDMNPCKDTSIRYLSKQFKVIIALRSEYVCELDYWSMQRYFIPSLKHNRYYLKALTGDAAECIVNNILEKTKIGNISKTEILDFCQNEYVKENKKEPCMSALKLSLICATCYKYKEKVNAVISELNKEEKTLSLLSILELYYDEATCNLTIEQRNSLENSLVDSKGRRNKVTMIELSSIINENLQAELLEKRIISTINSDEVEIAHDCMCEVVSKHCKERQRIIEKERDAALKNKWIVIAFVVLAMCSLLSFFLFRNLGYQEIKEIFDSKNTNQFKAITNVIFYRGLILLFIPYLLPLLSFIAYCCKSKKAKRYISKSEMISIITGTLFILASCFFYDSIFNRIIGIPTISDSLWGVVVVPSLFFLTCISYLWKKVYNIWKKTIVYICLIISIAVVEIVSNCVNIIVLGILLLVGISFLFVVFKNLGRKEKWMYSGINALILAISVINHFGANPFKFYHSTIEKESIPWHSMLIQKNKKIGIVDAITADTIVPCLFDDVTSKGLVMYLTPNCSELADSLLEKADGKSTSERLEERSDLCVVNGKVGLRYIWQLDKRLYSLKNEGTLYERKAAKVYFMVREKLYKAIKGNYQINKINTTDIVNLYKMECDSVKVLTKALTDTNNKATIDNMVSSILVHTARQMAIASILDMINDNRSKMSLLIAFETYRVAFFSREMHDEHFGFIGNVIYKYNETVNHSNSSNGRELPNNKVSYMNLAENVFFSNENFTTIDVMSLWQYVYANSLCITVSLYEYYMEMNLQNEMDHIWQPQINMLEKLLDSTTALKKEDVNLILGNLKKEGDLETSIKSAIPQYNSRQLLLVDSIFAGNEKFKSFNPVSFFDKKSLAKGRESIINNIDNFYILYNSCLFRGMYQYSIFRNCLISSLKLALFSGENIVDHVIRLEKRDSLFLSQTFSGIDKMAHRVDTIRKNAKYMEDKYYKKIRNLYVQHSTNAK